MENHNRRQKLPPGRTLATKFLEFLDQNGQSQWYQFERLVDLKNKNSRSARTGKILRWLQEKTWVRREMTDKGPRYTITELGRRALKNRKTTSQLTASAPFYFEYGKTEFISFGEELSPADQEGIADFFEKHPHLRGISCVDRERSR